MCSSLNRVFSFPGIFKIGEKDVFKFGKNKGLSNNFSNSLIIHEEKTKEITTVKKIRRSFALIFSKNYQCFEKLYQTLFLVFDILHRE